MLTDEDWTMAEGVTCPGCQNASYRIIGGLCPSCYQAREMRRAEVVEDKTMRRYYMRGLREGTISLARMREGLL